MRKLFLLTLTLCMMSCSTEEHQEPKILNNPIRQSEIVGVWENGEYFMSFDGEGYYAAYLSERYMNYGDYELQYEVREGELHFYPFADSVIVTRGEMPEQYSQIVISDLDSTSLKMELVTPQSISLTLYKTKRDPVVRNPSLIGKEYMGITFTSEHTATYEGNALYYFLFGNILYFGEVFDRCIDSNIRIWELKFDSNGNIISHTAI